MSNFIKRKHIPIKDLPEFKKLIDTNLFQFEKLTENAISVSLILYETKDVQYFIHFRHPDVYHYMSSSEPTSFFQKCDTSQDHVIWGAASFEEVFENAPPEIQTKMIWHFDLFKTIE